MVAGTGIGLTDDEKGLNPVAQAWKDGAFTSIRARARVASAVQAAQTAMRCQRNSTVTFFFHYEPGDETRFEVYFLLSLDGAKWFRAPSDDAASAGVSRMRPLVKTMFPADFPNTAAGGAGGTATPWDDSIAQMLSTADAVYTSVSVARVGGSAGGAGFLTVDAIGGGQS